MTVKRKVEITVESERLVLVSGQRPGIAWCAECAAPAEAITLQAAAALAQAPEETVREWLRKRLIHFLGASDGFLICRRGLEAYWARR